MEPHPKLMELHYFRALTAVEKHGITRQGRISADSLIRLLEGYEGRKVKE